MRHVWLVFVLAAFAGCAEPDADGPADEPPAETGTIAGVVVDERIQALVGAVVTLTPGDREQETDLFGRFDFFDVEPGVYEVRAVYEGVGTSETIELEAGERERPRLVLSPPRPRVPVHETLSWSGYKELHAGPADNESAPAKESTGTTECTCTFQFGGDPDLVAIVVEAHWEDSIDPGPTGPTEFHWTLRTPTGWQAEGSGSKPLLAVVTPGDFAGGDGTFRMGQQGLFEVHLEPGPDWVAAQQSFDLFVTTWLVAEPPEGWSWIGGDA